MISKVEKKQACRTLRSVLRAPEALTPGEVVGMCRELSKMGFNYVVFNMPNDYKITPIEVIGEEVIPEIRDM